MAFDFLSDKEQLKKITAGIGVTFLLVLLLTTMVNPMGTHLVVYLWAMFLSLIAGFVVGLIQYEALEEDADMGAVELMRTLLVFFIIGIILLIVSMLGGKALEKTLFYFQLVILGLAVAALLMAGINHIINLREHVAGTPAPSTTSMKAAGYLIALVLFAMLLTFGWNHFHNPLAPTTETEQNGPSYSEKQKARKEALRKAQEEKEAEEARKEAARKALDEKPEEKPVKGKGVTVTIPSGYHLVEETEEEKPKHYPPAQ